MNTTEEAVTEIERILAHHDGMDSQELAAPKRLAMPRPIPLPAPVTRAVFA